jgi:molybdopterin converting factor small subunit
VRFCLNWLNGTRALEGLLLENGQIRQHVILTINGHLTSEMDAWVMEQDVLAIFPPIAGG